MPDPWTVAATIAQVVAGIAAIAALAFAYFAIRASRDTIAEMRRQFEESHQPQVILDADMSDPPMAYLVISNAGDAAARNVTVSFDPPFEYRPGKPMKDLPVFSQLQYLPPGKQIRFFLDSTIGMKERRPTRFVAKIKFESTTGKKFEHDIPVDIEAYFDLLYTRRHTLHELVERVAEVSKGTQKTADELAQLKTRLEEGLRIRGLGERRTAGEHVNDRVHQRLCEARLIFADLADENQQRFFAEQGRELYARIQMIEEDLLSMMVDKHLAGERAEAVKRCAVALGDFARTEHWSREELRASIGATLKAIEDALTKPAPDEAAG